MGIFFPFSHAQERRGVGAEPPAAVATCQEHRAGSLQSGQQLFGTDEDAVRQRGPESDALGSADAQEGQVQGRQGRLKWCGYHEAISVTHSSYCSPSSRSAMPANLFTCFFCFLQKKSEEVVLFVVSSKEPRSAQFKRVVATLSTTPGGIISS